VIYSIVIYSLNGLMKMNDTKKMKNGEKEKKKKRGDECLSSQRVMSVMQTGSNDGGHRHIVVVYVGIFVN